MYLKSPISKQAKDIYTLLLRKGAMSAKQIGKELHIFPHAVYRSAKQLKSIGCVTQNSDHPTRFEAIPVNESAEAFAWLQRSWFLDSFLQKTSEDPFIHKELNISFIDSRDMLFEKALVDINNARDAMDNLASGDELPAEIMLAQKNALERGVTIRTLFQKRNEGNESFIQARVKMGEQLRITKSVNTRIVIFDQRIVYIMSYDPDDYIKSNGIRFEYAPVGQLMYQVFLEHWIKGVSI